MAIVLSVIAPEGFQEIEYSGSKAALEANGHTVVTACSEPIATDKNGKNMQVDVLLDEVRADDYDAVMFIGGPGCYSYFDDPVAHKVAKDFYNNEKPTTAICAAPSILANAGLLKGRKCTCFPSEADSLKSKGANYTAADVETDGLIITANGPGSAKIFGEAVAHAL